MVHRFGIPEGPAAWSAPRTPPAEGAALTVATAAAPPRPERLFTDVLPLLGVAAGLAIIGFVAVMVMRRRLRADPSASAPFSLDDLRQLHRDGKLSDDEFKRARDAIIGATKRALVREPARKMDKRR